MTASHNPPLAGPIRTADSHFVGSEHRLTVVDANNAVLFTADQPIAREIVRRLNGHAELVTALAQLISHWDSAIAAEGGEFPAGSFDSVKDVLDAARAVMASVNS